ncbi:MAG: uracil-DNA glycosylase [Flavobacteriales bacterium]|nr:uracil-DNA glycosylase [Flavobacteriales bacterium]
MMSPSPPTAPAPLALGPGWERVLRPQMEQGYFQRLKEFLVAERMRHSVYPKGGEILRAFQETAFEEVRVVILGQDPYHGPGQAHGLCFSVPVGVPPPPSLANVMVEIERDLGLTKSPNGDLTSWARQGVLLLNAVLTVRADQAASHQGQGWEQFTDAAIRALAEERSGIVFLLWGRYAQQKEASIPMDRHYVLKAPHPSPLSAHRGFIGCGHFSMANELLAAQGLAPIDWRIP